MKRLVALLLSAALVAGLVPTALASGKGVPLTEKAEVMRGM